MTRVGIIAHAGLGGSGTVATDLAVGLSARGHEVHMITPRRPFRLNDDCDVRVHELQPSPHAMWESPPWGLALASRIAEVVAEYDLEVLHAHFAMPYAVSTEFACRLLGSDAPPWVATLHGSDVEPLGRDPVYAPLIRHALSHAHAVTVPSRYLQQAAEHLTMPIDVIPNFVDGDRFAVASSRTTPDAGEAIVVHASNFREVKRVRDVVSVFSRVAATIPARLLLVGDGPQRKDALAELTKLGLAHRVEAPGAERDVERWLSRAHIALVPSAHESFGLAALEALACGVPVIGSRVGGLPEVVQHDHTGYLAAAGDIDAMAQHALDLLTDVPRWREMAEAARARAVAHFAPTRALQAYEAVYNAALAGAPAHHREHPTQSLHDA